MSSYTDMLINEIKSHVLLALDDMQSLLEAGYEEAVISEIQKLKLYILNIEED